MNAETIATISLAAAIGLPLLTLIVQQTRDGRSAFRGEAMDRIDLLEGSVEYWKNQFEDCHRRLVMPAISGGEGPEETEPFMVSPDDIADVRERLQRGSHIPGPEEHA